MAPLDHPCDVSPSCRPMRDVLGSLGLSLDLPWRWVHVGPINARAMVIVEHTARRRLLTRRHQPANGLGRFGGYTLDLLGLADGPSTLAARYYPEPALWAVYAVAARPAEGIGVEWRADPSGGGTFAPVGLDHHDPVPDAGAIIGRCFDLLLGRALGALAQRAGGRPRGASLELQAQHNALAAEAEAIKAADPGKTYTAIARTFGIDERTLRTYRADLRTKLAADGALDLRRSS